MDSRAMADELLNLILKYETLPFQKKLENMARGELLLLSYLNKSSEGMLPSELSHLIHVSTARVTAIVNSLEKKGMVVRELSSCDRREVNLFITKQGEDCLNSRFNEIENELTEILEFLGKKDALDYLRITRRLLEFSSKSK